MTHRLHRSYQRAVAPLAPLALSVLSAAALLPFLPEPPGAGQPSSARPAVQWSGPGPGPAAVEVTIEPPAIGLDAVALVAAQRRKGLACDLTSSHLPVCTHGGDPHLRDVPDMVTPAGGPSGSATGSRLGCYGNGRDGLRVQAVYARPVGAADRYAAVLPDLRRYAAGADATFDAAARTTKGRRHVRFATTPSCELDVSRVVLESSSFRSMRALVEALQVKGFGQSARTYLVWADTSVLCGIATMYVDDSPGLDNLNNGALPSYARVDRPCWGKAEVHELVHAFGGVQPSAPHSTGGYHCSDGADVMCYDDKTARSTQRAVCPKSSAQVLDCRHDDYFSTAAPRGSYLQTRWNVARSSFLSSVWDDRASAPAASASSTPSPGQPSPSPSRPQDASPSPPPSPSPAVSSPAPSATPSPLLGVLPLPPLPTVLPTRPVPTSAPALVGPSRSARAALAATVRSGVRS